MLYLLFMFSTSVYFYRSLYRNMRVNTSLMSSHLSTIVTKNNNYTYSQNETSFFLLENPYARDKKLISISPGGYKGFYMMGVAAYVKTNYDLSNYVFSGASAGAWNSLLMTYRHDIRVFKNHLTDTSITNAKSIAEMEQVLKSKLLESYTEKDFDLDRLFVGVTTIKRGNKPTTTIYTRFTNLGDAIDCCIASSHIPFVTGNMTYTYNNLLSFDGGFSKYPYLGFLYPKLHITPSMWRTRDTTKKIWTDIHEYTTLFSKDRYQFDELYDRGYKDAESNRVFLDKSLLQ